MKAYSVDLRQRVLDAVDAGTARAEVARVFQVSLPTIRRYLKQRREGANLIPKVSPGRRRVIHSEQMATLQAQWRTAPDATLEQHCQQWQAAQERSVSPATMARALRRLGWTRKKSKSVPVSAT